MKPGVFHDITVYSVPSLDLVLSFLPTNAQNPTNTISLYLQCINCVNQIFQCGARCPAYGQ